MIIEDQQDKRDDIANLLCKWLNIDNTSISSCSSLHSALRSIVYDEPYDLVMLDMSLPTFDISSEEPTGGTSESYGGKELLYQMMLRDTKYPTVVVTQYMSFNKGSIDLLDLDQEFQREFSDFYLGYVYYNAAVDDWKNALIKILGEFKK
ncbi:hypothetical protein ACET97_04550 [Aeromonas enteropelogenes]